MSCIALAISALAACGCAAELGGSPIGGPPIDFNRHIRPILSSNCYRCHGPDDAQRKAGLRLDVADKTDSHRTASGAAAIVPGQPAQSELYRRITAENGGQRMPPAGLDLELTSAQIELIRRWIEQGARRQQHWAFVAPARPAPPPVSDPTWVRNPIDAFVLARLDEARLTPAPAADRMTLVRRLHLDLIGLPPSPAEADAFVRDERDDAYERLVDSLLDSPHYGERWARPWLDLARYADTNGYEKDRERSIWPYRDWVIAALNADMPFDQFTVEQIAGDLLPQATLSQRIATGFHRNTMVNEEGGVDAEEFRYLSIVDRVNTTGTVWLGLTVGCAQCHSHKYDPLSQQEYFGLFAFLDNADEPEITVPDADVTRRQAEHDAKTATIERELRDKLPALQRQFATWRNEAAQTAVRWTRLTPTSLRAVKGTSLDLLPDGSLLAGGDQPNDDVYELEADTDLSRITALRLDVLPHDSLPDGGPGRSQFQSVAGVRGDFLLTELVVQAGAHGSDRIPLQRLLFNNASDTLHAIDRPASMAIDGDIESGWSLGRTNGEAQSAVFRCAEPFELSTGSRLSLRLVQQSIYQFTIGRFQLWATSDERPAAANRMPADDEALLLRSYHELSPGEQQRLLDAYVLIGPELAPKQELLSELRSRRPQHPTTLALAARPPRHARTTHRRRRGDFLMPLEAVAPAVPAVLPALPEGTIADRLALARWLVAEDNPLVGRVTMNRQWQALFGRGLVRTTDDFGAQGAPPSHPELLDWLATEFIRRGWSRKAMQRLMVTSATYRQASGLHSECQERDPHNLLLSRGARFRVDAEQIRDCLLAASGLLSHKIGGPSVFPPQPEGVSELAYGHANWIASIGPDRYRRGLYTHAKRAAPYAMFSLLDAPSGEACIVRRERSNTPLQALTLLNDAVFMETAQALARRTLAEAGATDEERATRMFRLCLTRPPEAEEVAAIVDFVERRYDGLRAGKPADARPVAGLSEGDPADGDAVCQLAAWTLAARVLQNLDETITRE